MPRRRPWGSAIREPVSHALGTPAKVAAVRVLAGAGAPITQRDAARRAGIQHRSMGRALDDLVALGIVDRTVGGRDHLVRLNPEHRLHAPLTALIARESELFLEVRQRLTAIAASVARKAGLASVVLFGSVARAQDRVDSDCDVLVVARDAAGLDVAMTAFEHAADSLRRTYGCAVRPIGYVRADAARKLRSRAAPFPDITRDNVVVYGPPLAEALRGKA